MARRAADRQDQRQEDRQEFGRGGSAETYKMRDEIVSIGDDFWIENDQGRKVFKIDGKMIRVRDILRFEDAKGHTLVDMASKLVQVRDTVKLDRVDGKGATVKKDVLNLLGDDMVMEVDGGTKYDIKGNLLDHEYTFYDGRDKVAEVSKRWFRVADTYGIQIAPGHDDVLFLAATVAVDQLSHDVA